MSVTESRERPDLPTLTESLPLDEAGLTAALAAARKPAPDAAASAPPASGTVDIELPFRVRAVDDGDASGASRRGAPPPVVTTPFAPLLDRLLDAGPGPFGLTVEVKHDHRVVGIWDVYLGPGDPGDIHMPQASGVLYACVAADGNLRETAAFLVLEHWWVNSADPMQFDELYEGLTYAVLDRFDALMDGAAAGVSMPPYVLYLIDGRAKKPRVFKAARLERVLLRALGDGRAVPGLDLHVAHGRSTGVSPISATLPADLSSADIAQPDVPTFASDASGSEPAKKAPPPEPVRRRAEEVFVAERLSEANLRWMRKGSGAPS